VIFPAEPDVLIGPVKVFGCGRRCLNCQVHLPGDQLLGFARWTPLLNHVDCSFGRGVSILLIAVVRVSSLYCQYWILWKRWRWRLV
jgi:hypothetical protein